MLSLKLETLGAWHRRQQSVRGLPASGHPQEPGLSRAEGSLQEVKEMAALVRRRVRPRLRGGCVV